ncbi:hypothetical protein HYR69_01185 [Candidatus Sumerlaeota bacterium]|nr:hypothetical protein [Candidatus Sumerlaeota bacterium]
MDKPPSFDWLKFVIRFGCGFIFAAFVEFACGLTDSWEMMIVDLIVAVTCGSLAWRRGDEFWETVASWRWWY